MFVELQQVLKFSNINCPWMNWSVIKLQWPKVLNDEINLQISYTQANNTVFLVPHRYIYIVVHTDLLYWNFNPLKITCLDARRKLVLTLPWYTYMSLLFGVLFCKMGVFIIKERAQILKIHVFWANYSKKQYSCNITRNEWSFKCMDLAQNIGDLIWVSGARSKKWIWRSFSRFFLVKFPKW